MRVPLSVLLTLSLDFPTIGSVAGTAQHPAQVDNRLGVDVLMRGDVEEFALRPDANGNHAIAVLHDRADRLQLRDHGVPPPVVVRRNPENPTPPPANIAVTHPRPPP